MPKPCLPLAFRPCLPLAFRPQSALILKTTRCGAFPLIPPQPPRSQRRPPPYLCLSACPQAHIVHNVRIFELAATLSPEEMELLTALATLAESGPRRLRPAYARDLHHLVRDAKPVAKPAGAAAAAESVASV